MKRSVLLILVAAISISTGAWLWAQTPTKAPPPTGEVIAPFGSDGSKPAAQPAAKPAELASSPPLANTTIEAVNLRNQFLELSKKKAQLLKEAELKREIQLLERQIPELEAWSKADEAARLLHEVIEKHPDTQAAKSAQQAIRVIESNGRLVPVPDDFGLPAKKKPSAKEFRRDAPIFDVPQPQPRDSNFSS